MCFVTKVMGTNVMGTKVMGNTTAKTARPKGYQDISSMGKSGHNASQANTTTQIFKQLKNMSMGGSRGAFSSSLYEKDQAKKKRYTKIPVK